MVDDLNINFCLPSDPVITYMQFSITDVKLFD